MWTFSWIKKYFCTILWSSCFLQTGSGGGTCHRYWLAFVVASRPSPSRLGLDCIFTRSWSVLSRPQRGKLWVGSWNSEKVCCLICLLQVFSLGRWIFQISWKIACSLYCSSSLLGLNPSKFSSHLCLVLVLTWSWCQLRWSWPPYCNWPPLKGSSLSGGQSRKHFLH